MWKDREEIPNLWADQFWEHVSRFVQCGFVLTALKEAVDPEANAEV